MIFFRNACTVDIISDITCGHCPKSLMSKSEEEEKFAMLSNIVVSLKIKPLASQADIHFKESRPCLHRCANDVIDDRLAWGLRPDRYRQISPISSHQLVDCAMFLSTAREAVTALQS